MSDITDRVKKIVVEHLNVDEGKVLPVNQQIASKSFLRIGPRQQLVQSLFAISSLDALSFIAVLIFSPALISFVSQFMLYFNTSEKL